MPFKIKDNQIDRYFHDGEIYEDVEDAVEDLASYHDIDFTGVDDNDNELTIWEYMEKFRSPEEKMEWLQDWGDWEIEEIIGIECPLCKGFAEYQDYNGTHLWVCHGETCPFVALEYKDEQDLKNLNNRLN
jgi:hypothetical protein